MNLQRYRGLRNEEGGSPGGGSVPPNGAPAPSNPAPTAGASTPDIAAIVKSVVTETFGELKNGLFADLRKSGALDKGKDDKGTGGSGATAAGANPPAVTQQQNSSAPAAPSMDDINRMMERRDALHGAIPPHLSPGARQRVLKDFAKENPEDPVAWAKGYLSDFGLDRPNGSANPPTQQPPNQNPNAAPAVNGQPPPAAQPAPNTSIVTDRPVDVLQWDRDMMAKYYASKGGNSRDFSDPRNSKIWDEIATMTRSAAAQLQLLKEPRK